MFPHGPTIKKVMQARGYTWFPDQNVVTVETMTPAGILCGTGPNTFDDIKMVLDGAGNVIGGPWVATSHPGYYWTENPMASGGAFIIALGQQTCWTPGDYHNLTVWRQAEDSTIMGHRDPNCTYRRQGAPVAHGDIGVHHHGGGNQPQDDIGTRAAGCQVIEKTADQAEFMRVTLQNPPYLLNPGSFRLTATVLQAKDILDVQGVAPPPPALPPPPPPAPIPVPPLPANPPSPLLILDTAQDVTAQLSALKALGYGTVIRYLTTNTASEKCIKPAEARAIAAAGMRLCLVFEILGGVDNFANNDINLATGVEHAQFCLQYAPTVGALPSSAGAGSGACIYFAIDTDATSTQIGALVLPYLHAIKTAMGNLYRVGVYGCGAVCQAALGAGYADLAWLANAMGWNGSRAFKATNRWVLCQSLPATVAGLDTDPDTRQPGADIGDFVPFAAAPAPQPAPAPTPGPDPGAAAPLVPAPAFTQDGLATWYSDNANADPAWPNVNNATDMTAAHNTLPFGTPVRVTRTDTQASCVVTIHDRGGPALSGNRIIDLRPAPATAIDMLDAGIVPVHIETVPDRSHSNSGASSRGHSPSASSAYTCIHTAAFP